MAEEMIPPPGFSRMDQYASGVTYRSISGSKVDVPAEKVLLQRKELPHSRGLSSLPARAVIRHTFALNKLRKQKVIHSYETLDVIELSKYCHAV